MNTYHSSTLAITESKAINRFKCVSGVAFKHDIMATTKLPTKYAEADVIYVEPPWRRGLAVFAERSKLELSFAPLMLRVEELVIGLGTPAIVIMGKDGSKFLKNGIARCGVTLVGPKTPQPAFAIGYGIRPNFSNTTEAKKALAREFHCVGDFCCGYGTTCLEFVKANKHFVASDSDSKALGVFYSEYKKLTKNTMNDLFFQ